MDKLIVDGKVAVIVSPGFGAGWSTWGAAESCMDGELAKAILDGETASVVEGIAERNWPDAYQGGLHQAVVEWVDEGTQFEIREYDGHESLHTAGETPFLRA